MDAIVLPPTDATDVRAIARLQRPEWAGNGPDIGGWVNPAGARCAQGVGARNKICVICG